MWRTFREKRSPERGLFFDTKNIENFFGFPSPCLKHLYLRQQISMFILHHAFSVILWTNMTENAREPFWSPSCSRRALLTYWLTSALTDVKRSLASLRGSAMPSSFSWSYKRSYKQGFVWQDLESDKDLIFPTHGGSEYVLKGCKINSLCIVQASAFPQNAANNAISHVVNDISTPMEPLITKVPELSSDEKASKKFSEISSSASLLAYEDNHILSPAIIEGLEHLHRIPKNDLHYEIYAESQASTSPDHINGTSKHGKHGKQKDSSHQTYFEKLASKEGAVPYSHGLGNLTKDRCVGTLFNSSRYLVVNSAAQLGKDDKLPIQHTKRKLTYPSECFNLSQKLACPILQTAGSLASTSRDHMLLKDKLITQSCSSRKLSTEETSPSPCSTSLSRIASLHSAASCNTVARCKVDHHSQLSFDQLAKDQIFQEKRSLLIARGHQSEDSAHSEKAESAIMGSAAQGICNDDNLFSRLITSSSLEELNQDSRTGPVDNPCLKSKSPLDSTNVKRHHEMSILSSSGRFLRLASCGGGLEVIRLTQRNSNKSNRERVGNCKESSVGTANFPSKIAKEDSPCMHTFLADVNDSMPAISSSLPIVITSDVLSGGYSSLARGDNETDFFAQEAKTSNKLWHVKGWVSTHYKKIKSRRYQRQLH